MKNSLFLMFTLLSSAAYSQISISTLMDYNNLDRIAQSSDPGIYRNWSFRINSNYTGDDSTFYSAMNWVVARFDTLVDLYGNGYNYDSTMVRIDNIPLYIIHYKAVGTPDTIIVKILARSPTTTGLLLDTNNNFFNTILWSDTVFPTQSISPNEATYWGLPVAVGLQLPRGTRFLVSLEYYGDKQNTFHIGAGGKELSSCSCGAAHSVYLNNSYYKIATYPTYPDAALRGGLGVNSYSFDCNHNGISGEAAFCELYVIQNLRIPLNVTYNVRAITISGAILTEAGTPVAGVTVSLSGADTQTVITDTAGRYGFTVGQGGNYTVTPLKNNDVVTNNGVTLIDALLMRRHILGTPLNSPYKIIAAAEVNAAGDTTITTQDILFTRSLILGNITGFPTNRLWQFVPSDYVFPDNNHPFSFPTSRTYTNIQQSLSDQNFIGIKLGDVNGSWDANTP